MMMMMMMMGIKGPTIRTHACTYLLGQIPHSVQDPTPAVMHTGRKTNVMHRAQQHPAGYTRTAAPGWPHMGHRLDLNSYRGISSINVEGKAYVMIIKACPPSHQQTKQARQAGLGGSWAGLGAARLG